jgi:ABC-type transport system substrate-binding protein
MPTTRARASVCVIAALSAVLTACTGDARRADPDEFTKVRIGTISERGVGFLTGLLSAEPLVSVAFDGQPVYRLAESAVTSADGTTLTVTLQRSRKFHSGDPVTADRVRDLLTAKIGTEHQDVASIEASGTYTLIFHLKRANAFKPVDLGDVAVDSEEDLSLRTGPFRIKTRDSTSVLEPFTGYAQGIPEISRVEIEWYANQRAAWTAMMRGEVNFLHEVNRDAIDFIEAGGNIKAYPALRPYVVSLVFNMKHRVLGRRDVRVALNEAINRQDVVETGMRGHGIAAEGPIWLHHWAYPREGQAPLYRPEASKLLLEQSGFRIAPRGAKRMASRFSFTCLVINNSARLERTALVVQRQLYAIGVDMELQFVSVADFSSRTKTGDFDAFIADVASGRTLRFPYRFWHSSSSDLRSGYTSADQALDRMLVARDEDVKAAVAEVLRVMRDDPPAIFLAFPREARALDRSFEVPYEDDRDIFGTFWRLKRVRPALDSSR